MSPGQWARVWGLWLILLIMAAAVILGGAHLLALMPVWASWTAAAAVAAGVLYWTCRARS